MKKPYSKYKPTNIPWIGNIPEGWDVSKLKFGVTYNDDVLSETTDENYTFNYVEIGDVNSISGITNKTEVIFKDSPSRARRIAYNGDVIISTVRTYLGAISRIDEDDENLVVSTGFAVLRPKTVNSKFLGYLVTSKPFIEEIIAKSKGVSYPAINTSDLVNLKGVFPSLQEQKGISEFLDKKTAEIDQAVKEKGQLLKLYEEEKKAIINNAVTKGLNTNANLKDTGVEWLGSVPEHWEVKKLKYLTQIQGRIGFKGYSKSDLVEEGEGALTIGAKHINNNNELDLSNPEYLSWDKYLESPEIFVNQNDLLVTQRGTLGKVVLINQNIGEATINPSMLILREMKCNYKFLFNVLSSAVYTMWIENISSGTAVPMISQEQLKNFQIALPKNSDEQNQIVDFIEKKIFRINSKKELVQKEIKLLKEYKQALIYEAVTGKIDVRNN